MTYQSNVLDRFLRLEAAAGHIDREGQALLEQDLDYSTIYDPSALLEKYISAFDEVCSSQRRLTSDLRINAALEAQARLVDIYPEHEATRRWKELQQWFYGGADLLGQSVDAAVNARFRVNVMRKCLEWFDRGSLAVACLTAFVTERFLRAHFVPAINRPDYDPLLAAFLILWLQNLFFGSWATAVKKRCGWFIFTCARRTLRVAYDRLAQVSEQWRSRGQELVLRATTPKGSPSTDH